MMLKYKHLEGRRGEHGVLDCYSLIRDFYRDNFEIELSDYARPDDWWHHGMDLYMENFRKEGFEPVDDDPRPGDLFLIAVQTEVACHAAVYIGDGKILHHLIGRMSRVETYRGYWRQNTLAHIRHKDVPHIQEEPRKLDIMDQLPAHKRRMLNVG